MKEQKRELGFRLREAITQKGYTAEQFSEATGIPYETVQNYLKGKIFHRLNEQFKWKRYWVFLSLIF